MNNSFIHTSNSSFFKEIFCSRHTPKLKEGAADPGEILKLTGKALDNEIKYWSYRLDLVQSAPKNKFIS